MNYWGNLRVATRLTLAFTLVGTVCLGWLGNSVLQQRISDASIHQISKIEMDKLADAYELHAAVAAVTPRIIGVNISKDPKVLQTFGPEIKPFLKRINVLHERVGGWISTDEEKAWFKEFDDVGQKVLASLTSIGNAHAAGDNETAEKLIQEVFLPNAKTYENLLPQLVRLERERLSQNATALQQEGWNRWAFTASIAAGILAIVGLLVFSVVRTINRAMRDANHIAAEVAKGNLTVHVSVEGHDEFSDLNRSLTAMASSLREVVERVRGGTEEISAASGEIAQGNQDLSQRTERQAGHLQQTASTMEELAATVQQTADSAAKANDLSGRAREIAERSGAAVGQVVFTMGQIEQSSKRIEEIISVIGGISFQTNILALNAAVEAARAGEQGRGFAVVAGEVRNLAQRSANAAKEIKQLIADSSEKVRVGSSQVQVAGSTMDALQASVQQVTTLISEISAAADEQRKGISNVSQSVNELDQTTQQNSALVEQSAAAAASMREQAARLAQSVSVFRINSQPSMVL
ncbi:MAG: methyl-accepting chemotaxis protein [Pigmentiphaga sp.]|uniref:methyl-accepting chemotaxis protein n=1 Tax=Pigmentiphaga sp. TaxID=1977564 RepID=UPI003B555463